MSWVILGWLFPDGIAPYLGSRVDIYSLGATLYCAVTSKHPYSGKNMLEVIKRSLNGTRSITTAVSH